MSKAASNILQILADLPDFLRRPMLQSRLKEFYSMGELERRETIGMALSAAPTINPNKLAVLFRTWLDIISDLDSEKREIMIQTYCRQILSNPHSVEKLDFQSLTKEFLSLDQKRRERVTDTLHEVLFSIPNRAEILKMVPDESLAAVGLK